MAVDFDERGPPATDADIEDLLTILPGGAHADWISFLRTSNGARPAPNTYPIPPDDSGRVRSILSASGVQETRQEVEGGFPEGCVPIADDGCGNYVCLVSSPRECGVAFWDHETGALSVVAATFTEFLGLLEPFDPDSVKLDPADVISVWVAPGFLESLKDDE